MGHVPSHFSRAPEATCRNAASLPPSGPALNPEAVELDALGHQPGPAGLVAGAQPCAVVAVEVLVEEDVIPPMRIGLELLRAAVNGSPAVLVAE